MNALVARAPGKLFLLGEYAVLDGCPAVVAAIDRHVRVLLRPDPNGLVRICTADHGTAEFSARNPAAAYGPLRFAIAAVATARRRFPVLGDTGMRIEIASDLDGRTGSKTGLGSSAAVTVAIVAALCAAAQRRGAAVAFREAVFATAFEAHRAAQGGAGSGADVAASVYGGLSLFRPANHAALPTTAPLRWPDGTTLLAAWSGEPASTSSMVQRYRATANRGNERRTAFVTASHDGVERFVAGLARAELDSAAVEACGRALEQLGTDLGLPIMTSRLRQIVAIARARGAAAKVSGAGGGDCAIALALDRVTAEGVRTAWRTAGLTPLNLRLSQEGVTVADC